MSIDTPSEVSPPQNLSVVEAFKAAPTLVKVLAAGFYLPAIHVLVLAVVTAAGPNTPAGASADTALAFGLLFFGFLFALIGFLLGKGIARGAYGTWRLALILCALAVPGIVINVMDTVTVDMIVNAVLLVATVALLLTPVVRQHCTKK